MQDNTYPILLTSVFSPVVPMYRSMAEGVPRGLDFESSWDDPGDPVSHFTTSSHIPLSPVIYTKALKPMLSQWHTMPHSLQWLLSENKQV